MSDPVFAAEMAAVAADRRAREAGRVGDGMAAEGAVPGEPNGWMDFSGAKVPIHPAGASPGHGNTTQMRSTSHYHNGQSECLETVAGGIRLVPSGDAEVPEPGWVECSRNGVRYHLHGERLMAHFSGDKQACPDGVLP